MLGNAAKKGIPCVSKGDIRKYTQGDIDYDEGIYGNVWFRLIDMKKAGSIKKAHKHNFDHVHFVASGSVSVVKLEEGEDKKVARINLGTFTAPTYITVEAGVAHEVTALEDNTVALCVQPVRDDNNKLITQNVDETSDVVTTKL